MFPEKLEYNYHTHTTRCRHAQGTEREYIEAAIEGGYKVLGFSDHTPQPFEEEYYSGMRMRMAELEDYCDTLTALRDEYRDDIKIRIGLEAEYYPKYFEKLVEVTSQYPIEYFLLGQHHIRNEYDGFYAGQKTEETWVLKEYVSQSIEAMSTGKFLYFAHPSLIQNPGDDGLFRSEITRLYTAAKKMNIPLEINFLGLWDGRNYPNPLAMEIAGEIGNEVVFGADAHQVDKVVNPETYARAAALVKKYHLHYLENLEDRLN